MDMSIPFFVRAKHWQVFLIVVGFYLAGQIAFINSIILSSRPADYLSRFAWGVAILGALCTSVFFVWLWSLGKFLDPIIHTDLRMNHGLFRIALIYAGAYLILFMALSSNPRIVRAAIPLHLSFMLCMFYAVYFVSKALVLAETGKASSFYDYAGPFFLLWFFPIGIWILQPRIDRLYAEKG